MGSIARRPNGQWRARYRTTDGKEHARHFERRIDAQRFLTSEQNKVDRGSWIDESRSRITVGECSVMWLGAKQSLKPTARRSYAEVYRSLVEPTWGSVPLRAVSYGGVVSWLSELGGRGLSTARQRHGLLVLKQILDVAVFDERLVRNVVKAVKAPRPARNEPRFLTHAQLADLAESCGRYELLVLVLGYTGLRWGEARALKVRRLDLMRGRIDVAENIPDGAGEPVVVAPKSHKRRVVPLPKFLVEPLALHVAGKAQDDLVFTNGAGALLHNSNFRRDVFAPAVDSLGLAPFTPHNLRDTAASLAVSAGANVKVVQQMLGHASAAMTLDVYASLFADDLDTVAVRLNAAARAARESRGERSGTVAWLGG